MKSIVKQSSRKAAFTIIELLTVMSIIVILIGLLVPSLNMARRFAKKLTQKNQLRTVGIGIEFFNNEWDGYPPSGAFDGNGQQYCGAMKLAEAMVGKDLLGFHPDSAFRADGLDTTGRQLYDPVATLGARKDRFLTLDNAKPNRLLDIYGPGNTGSFLENTFVLCDIYTRDMRTGNKTGMPILYYKAETSNKLHDPNSLPTPTDNMGNIYNFNDNQAIFALGKPWEADNTSTHILSDPLRFYKNTRNDKIAILRRPYKEESYILMSAGFDGEYGTSDDIYNFEWKYRE